LSHYRFEFREDYADETVDGVELENDAAAQAEAVEAAREFMTDGIRKGIDRSGWISRVFDENGKLVATIKFSDLLEKRGSLQ
jgi:hypothetical protein